MRVIADGLQAAGQPVADNNLIMYIMGGVGAEFDAVVVTLTARGDLPSLSEVQAILQAIEMRFLQASTQVANSTSYFVNPSANLAQKDYKGNNNGKFKGKYKFNSKPKVICQLCGKNNHTALKCYKRFDVQFTGPDQNASTSQSSGSQQQNQHTNGSPILANVAQFRASNPFIPGNADSSSQNASDYSPSADWFMDSGATHHVTSQLENLNMQSPY